MSERRMYEDIAKILLARQRVMQFLDSAARDAFLSRKTIVEEELLRTSVHFSRQSDERDMEKPTP